MASPPCRGACQNCGTGRSIRQRVPATPGTEDRMKRRHFILAATAAALTLSGSGAAEAKSLADQVARTLRRAGYRDIEVQRTLLGRLRATGTNGDKTREIIVNSRTGEVLRDVILYRDGGAISSGYSNSEDEDRDDADNDDGGRGRGRGRGGDDGDGDSDSDSDGGKSGGDDSGGNDD